MAVEHWHLSGDGVIANIVVDGLAESTVMPQQPAQLYLQEHAGAQDLCVAMVMAQLAIQWWRVAPMRMSGSGRFMVW